MENETNISLGGTTIFYAKITSLMANTFWVDPFPWSVISKVVLNYTKTVSQGIKNKNLLGRLKCVCGEGREEFMLSQIYSIVRKRNKENPEQVNGDYLLFGFCLDLTWSCPLNEKRFFVFLIFFSFNTSRSRSGFGFFRCWCVHVNILVGRRRRWWRGWGDAQRPLQTSALTANCPARKLRCCGGSGSQAAGFGLKLWGGEISGSREGLQEKLVLVDGQFWLLWLCLQVVTVHSGSLQLENCEKLCSATC